MTRVELAEQIVKLLREQPMTSYELNAHFDCSADAVTGALGDLRRGGTVQLLGSTWRLLPGGASHSLPAPVSAAAPVRPAPRPTFAVNSSDVFFERPVVDEEPEPVAPEPAEAAPQPEPPEPVEMAKTKVCKACDVEVRRKAKGAPPAEPISKDQKTTIVFNGPVVDEEAMAKTIAAAIAEEPAPLTHVVQASEVAGATLDAFPVLGAVVIQQTAHIDGRRERQALLVARADLRGLIDQLTRLV